MTRKEKIILAISVLATFLTRLIQYLNTHVIAVDAVRYITGSELLFNGKITDGLRIADKPPVYFLLCTYVNFLVGNIEVSCHLVSILAASLTLVPLYLLTRNMFNQPVALASCFLFIILPHMSETQSDALTDSTYMLLFITSITLFWHSLKQKSLLLYALASVTGVVCYLTRTEGIYTLVIIVLTSLAMAIARKEYRTLATVGKILLAIFIFTVIAYPYLLWMKRETGGWTISMATGFRKLGEEITGPLPKAPSSDVVTGLLNAMLQILLRVIQLNYFIFVLPLVIGLIIVLSSREARIGAVFLLGIGFLYVIAPVRASLSGYAITERYIMLPMILLLPVAAFALIKGFNFVRQRLGWTENRARIVVIALTVLVSLPLLYRMLRERRRERIPLKEAGYWIRENAKDKVIYSIIGREEWRLMYYSKRKFNELTLTEDGLSKVSSMKDVWVIFETGMLEEQRPDVQKLILEHFIPIENGPRSRSNPKAKFVEVLRPKGGL
jgi:4-amino-4-deoxy-L-arabinose transferase-like glycosyltransferase